MYGTEQRKTLDSKQSTVVTIKRPTLGVAQQSVFERETENSSSPPTRKNADTKLPPIRRSGLRGEEPRVKSSLKIPFVSDKAREQGIKSALKLNPSTEVRKKQQKMERMKSLYAEEMRSSGELRSSKDSFSPYEVYNIPSEGISVEEAQREMNEIRERYQKLKTQLQSLKTTNTGNFSSIVDNKRKEELTQVLSKLEKVIDDKESRLSGMYLSLAQSERELKRYQNDASSIRIQQNEEVVAQMENQLELVNRQIDYLNSANIMDEKIQRLQYQKLQILEALDSERRNMRLRLQSSQLAYSNVRRLYEDVSNKKSHLKREVEQASRSINSQYEEYAKTARDQTIISLRLELAELSKDVAKNRQRINLYQDVIGFLDVARQEEDGAFFQTMRYMASLYDARRKDLLDRVEDAQKSAAELSKSTTAVTQELESTREELRKVQEELTRKKSEFENAKRVYEATIEDLSSEQNQESINNQIDQQSINYNREKAEKEAIQEKLDKKEEELNVYRDLLSSLTGSKYRDIADKLLEASQKVDDGSKELLQNLADSIAKTSREESQKTREIEQKARNLEKDKQELEDLLKNKENSEQIYLSILQLDKQKQQELNSVLSGVNLENVKALEKEVERLKATESSYQTLERQLLSLVEENASSVNAYGALQVIKSRLEKNDQTITDMESLFTQLVTEYTTELNEFGISVDDPAFKDLSTLEKNSMAVALLIRNSSSSDRATRAALQEKNDSIVSLQENIVNLRSALNNARISIVKGKSSLEEEQERSLGYRQAYEDLLDSYNKLYSEGGKNPSSSASTSISQFASTKSSIIKDLAKKQQEDAEVIRELEQELDNVLVDLDTSGVRIKKLEKEKEQQQKRFDLFVNRIKNVTGIEFGVNENGELVTRSDDGIYIGRSKITFNILDDLTKNGMGIGTTSLRNLENVLREGKDASKYAESIHNLRNTVLEAFMSIMSFEDNNEYAFYGYNWSKPPSETEISMRNKARLVARMRQIDDIFKKINPDNKNPREILEYIDKIKSLYDAAIGTNPQQMSDAAANFFGSYYKNLETPSNKDQASYQEVIKELGNGFIYSGKRASSKFAEKYIRYLDESYRKKNSSWFSNK